MAKKKIPTTKQARKKMGIKLNPKGALRNVVKRKKALDAVMNYGRK